MSRKRLLFKDVLREDLKDPSFRREYERYGPRLELAVEIIALRERRDMTQKQLAEAVGTAQSNISRIERGDQNLTLDLLTRIGAALNADLEAHLVARADSPSYTGMAQRSWTGHSAVADRGRRAYLVKKAKGRLRSKTARRK
jgi:transcriptional regulator with XRE-family HTH domain